MSMFTLLALPVAAAFLITFIGKLIGFAIERPDEFSIRHFARRVESAAMIVSALIITIAVGYQLSLAYAPTNRNDGLAQAPSGSLICVPGSITIDGSSALYALVKEVAKDYTAKCAQAKITVNESSSSLGLYNVESGQIDIADSDISALLTQGDLIDHRVAVVVFAIVTNARVTGVTNLTINQLKGIYNGTINNWNKVGGPDLSISAFARVPSSGTRTTFENYILCGPETVQAYEMNTTDLLAKAVQQTPGAIGYVDVGNALNFNLNPISIDGQAPLPDLVEQNKYKFWSVEHMYTKGLPLAGSLTSAFLQYMTNTPDEELIANRLSYVNFNKMLNSGLSSHLSCQ